jgi:hypothetical protein
MKTKTEEKKRLRAFGGKLVVLVAVIELLMMSWRLQSIARVLLKSN